MWRAGPCDALIALAVVVGANIKERMVFPVIPFYQLIIFLHKREEVVATLWSRLALEHLGQEPAARYNGMSLEQLR